MTVVFTAMTPSFIVVSADSAVTLEFENHREYERGRKSYFYEGIGCIATWGARDHNRIGPFLDSKPVSAESHSIGDVAVLVDEYLKTEIRPDESGVGEVGYHVAGFDKNRRPHLWTIFYGFDQPRPPEQKDAKYAFYHHEPPSGGLNFHYNGRNDLADPVVRILLHQIERAKHTNFDLTKAVDLVRMADFVVRFAAEITPEVGPPFITYLVTNNNVALTINNKTRCPIPSERIIGAMEAAEKGGL
jgi:hypothetical protein